MSRPEFPGCVLPPECIRSIIQEQSYYDEDPERYERQQREREQILKEEEEQEAYYRSIDEQRQSDLENYEPPLAVVEEKEANKKREELPF